MTDIYRLLLSSPAILSHTQTSPFSLSLSLSTILSHPHLTRLFHRYLKTCYAQENILFITHLNHLRKYTSQHALSKLIGTFIKAGGKYELNLTNPTKMRILNQYQQFHLYHHAQADVPPESWVHTMIKELVVVEEEVLDMLKIRVKEFNTSIASLLTPFSSSSYSMSCTKHQYKRVVIVGGGFAGVTLARILLSTSPHRFHITLIDTKDMFEYTPAAIHVLAGTGEPVRVKHEDMLRKSSGQGDSDLFNTMLVVGRVHSVYKVHLFLSLSFLVSFNTNAFVYG